MTTFSKKLSAGVLSATLLLSPAFVFAQERSDKNDDADRDNDRSERFERENRAFPHWRKSGEKKGEHRGWDRDDRPRATTTPPTATTTAPTIAGVSVSAIGTSGAAIQWVTNSPSSGTVFYGTTNPLTITAASTLSVSNTARTTGHSFTLSGLTASTTYFFIVQSTNTGGTTTSIQRSFTTAAVPASSNQVTLNAATVATHNTQNNCWMIIGGNVYNVTSYIPNHPGGVQSIVGLCGADATSAFGGIGHSSGATALLTNYLLGAVGQTITL